MKLFCYTPYFNMNKNPLYFKITDIDELSALYLRLLDRER